MADNNNTSWSISLNVSGTRPATGEIKNVPTGFYKGTIIEAYTMDARPDRLVMKIELEGEYQGAVRTTGLNFPKDPNDKVRYYWRAFMESMGYTPAQLDSGTIQLGLDAVKGRTVHFKYIEEDKSTNSRDQVNWFPPSDWAKAKASFVPTTPISRPQARPVVVSEDDTAAIANIAVTGPANGMGGGLGHGDLLSALNVR